MQYCESETLELKRELTSDISKEIVALCNTRGGQVILGVDDDGIVIGIKNPKDICERLSSIINDSIKPDITTMVSIETKNENDKEIIIIDVVRGTNRPYYLASKGLKPSGVYVRLGNTSIPANDNAIKQMITQTDGTSYESIRSFNQELSFDYAKNYFHKQNLLLESNNMKTLGMINNDGVFTNLGLLLSDECQHTIKVAVFEDNSKNKFIDRKEFSGSMLKQLFDVYDYLRLNNKKQSIYEGLNRIDINDYDDLVLRESLLNALIHRDYSFSGSIIINIFSDRMEFVSIGGLVPGININDIMLGISQSRNEKLANAFYRLELVETYGTGIGKILESYKKSPYKPQFSISSGAFLLMLPGTRFSKNNTEFFYKNINTSIATNDIEDDREEEYQIMELLSKNKSLSRKEIQDFLKLKQTKCLYVLKSMETTNKLQKIGKGKNVKYRVNKN